MFILASGRRRSFESPASSMLEEPAQRELPAVFKRLPDLGFLEPLRMRGGSRRRIVRNQVRQILAEGVVSDDVSMVFEDKLLRLREGIQVRPDLRNAVLNKVRGITCERTRWRRRTRRQ